MAARSYGMKIERAKFSERLIPTRFLTGTAGFFSAIGAISNRRHQQHRAVGGLSHRYPDCAHPLGVIVGSAKDPQCLHELLAFSAGYMRQSGIFQGAALQDDSRKPAEPREQM
jgi:hypothetical protein